MDEDEQDQPPPIRTVEVSLGDGWYEIHRVDEGGEVVSRTSPFHRRDDGADANAIEYLKSIDTFCDTDDEGRISSLSIFAEQGTPSVGEVLSHLSEIEHVQSLLVLSMSSADERQYLTDADLPYLTKWTRLHELELGKRLRLSGEGFSKLLAANPLPELEDLSIHSIENADLLLRSLANHQRLRVLSIGFSNATDEGISHLSKLPRLESLTLEQCNVSGAGFHDNDGWKTLKELSLTNGSASDRGLQEIAGIHPLTRLEVTGGRITDKGIEHLSRLENLTSLSIRETRVTAKGLEAVTRLPRLETLHISRTALGDEALPVLFNSRSLKTVFAFETNITEAGVARRRSGSALEIDL